MIHVHAVRARNTRNAAAFDRPCGDVMTEHRFACTACGKCCYGCVPVSIDEAIKYASLFPLAVMWTPLRPTNRAYALATKLGATFQLSKRNSIAVLITPTVYLPPRFACPALTESNLCAIHEHKPLRCRTMPFYSYREERDQASDLVSRKDWLCDTTSSAPVIYRDKKIVDRSDFDLERAALTKDAPILRTYANVMMQSNTSLAATLMQAAAHPVSGYFFVNFTSLLRIVRKDTLARFAQQQLPVLRTYEAKTADQPDLDVFHGFYQKTAAELEKIETARSSKQDETIEQKNID